MDAPQTLTIWDHLGGSRELQLQGPGDTVRVCVGDPNAAHATIWRIWSPRKHSDVYVAARDVAGYQKWSLHQSGDWRHQWVTERHARHVTGSDERLIDQWARPDELADLGWTNAFYIRVRRQDVIDYGDSAELPRDIIWVSPPPDDIQTVVIHVVLSQADRINEEVPGLVPLYAYKLANGEVVLILASLQEANEDELADVRSTLRSFANHPKVVRAAAPRMTISVVGEEDGTRGVWDLAMDKHEK